MVPQRYNFQRYLLSKQPVDDRALNADVWATLAEQMARRQAAGEVAVVEIGAGIGTMLHRLLRQGVLWRGTYTGVDAEPANIQRAGRKLPAWARQQGWHIEARRGSHRLSASHGEVTARFVTADYAALGRRPSQRRASDVVVAHAFLDLVPLETAVPLLLRMLRPGGLFDFSLNFDGETIFMPEIDRSLDGEIIEAYHRTMDERTIDGKPSGDSRTGRRLLAGLPSMGGAILAAGSSDWVVVPRGGGYPGDEAYFLHYICHTLWLALRSRGEIDPQRLRRWIEQRHRQVEHGELIYIAHQLDVVGVVPA
jgi:SAM-dependent methyltransferase